MSVFFGTFDIWQVLSSFIFLFAIIDPLGNLPITLNMQRKGVTISPIRVCLATIIILITFLFLKLIIPVLCPNSGYSRKAQTHK